MRQRIARKSPYILAQSAVPVCLAPNGTVATNGTITLGTALPTTYSGGIWLRLPAGAVSGGAAGLYWAVMSSATVGQVYTAFADPASPFTPYIPSGLVNAVGSNAAYTQTTAADVTLVNVTLPGGAMGPNGSIELQGVVAAANTANSKIFRYRLGTGSFINANAFPSVAAYGFRKNVYAAGSQSIQKSSSANVGQDIGSMSSNPNTYGAVDLSVDVAATLAINLATATDLVVIDSFRLTVSPS